MKSTKEIIQALESCGWGETDDGCHICPYRDERWNGSWETDDTTCWAEMRTDVLETLRHYEKALPPVEARKKMKAMLSQPMNGKSDKEIVATRERAIKALTEKNYEVVNTLFTDEWYSDKAMKERGVVQIPLCFLAKSLENMSLCHAAYFCKGWDKARGCKIEHDAAVAYGLDIIYEE